MGRLAKSGPGAQFDGLGDPVDDRARDGESTWCWRRVASTSMLIVDDAGLPEASFHGEQHQPNLYLLTL